MGTVCLWGVLALSNWRPVRVCFATLLPSNSGNRPLPLSGTRVGIAAGAGESEVAGKVPFAVVHSAVPYSEEVQ